VARIACWCGVGAIDVSVRSIVQLPHTFRSDEGAEFMSVRRDRAFQLNLLAGGESPARARASQSIELNEVRRSRGFLGSLSFSFC
jgi:hypothetical protein